MLPKQSATDSFSEFLRLSEVKLRQSLTPVLGVDVAREATAEAPAYGWEHWERVGRMDNPIGYLYRVGRSKGRRMKVRSIALMEIPKSETPEVEPGLPSALGRLSQRQRTAVMLVHCHQWTLSEVAELLGVSKSSVQSHLDRGMKSLRRSIGSNALCVVRNGASDRSPGSRGSGPRWLLPPRDRPPGDEQLVGEVLLW